MKKPVSDYVVQYPMCEKSNYYGDCESTNVSCDTCNSGDNTTGTGNGSGNSGSIGPGWGHR